MGFTDLGGAENTSPALTTLRNPVAEMVEPPIQTLIRKIRP